MITVLAAVLICGCGLSFSSGGGEQAWRSGYVAGTAARNHHKFRDKVTRLHLTAFCVEEAVTEVRAIKGPVVQWTEGFEKGCMRGLASFAGAAVRELISRCWS